MTQHDPVQSREIAIAVALIVVGAVLLGHDDAGTGIPRVLGGILLGAGTLTILLGAWARWLERRR